MASRVAFLGLAAFALISFNSCSGSAKPLASPATRSASPTTLAAAGTELSRSPVATATNAESVAPPCRASQLTPGLGGEISEPTGQATLTLTLDNSSQEACSLLGYPVLTLTSNDGSSIPFDYQHRGDQVVTANQPALVTLGGGERGYVTINKFRCDRGSQAKATALVLFVPDDPAPLSLPLPEYPRLNFCGPGDPENAMFVSPFAETLSATLARQYQSP